jgi:hypothetical protein
MVARTSSANWLDAVAFGAPAEVAADAVLPTAAGGGADVVPAADPAAAQLAENAMAIAGKMIRDLFWLIVIMSTPFLSVF